MMGARGHRTHNAAKQHSASLGLRCDRLCGLSEIACESVGSTRLPISSGPAHALC